MKFSNNTNFQLPMIEILQPAKKAVPYSITPIGNHAALMQWRKDQALMAEARDAFLKPIREATRLRAISMIANQNANTAPNALEQAEIDYRKVRATPTPAPTHKASYEAPEAPKETLGQRIKGAFKAIWTNAGFDI